MTSSEERNPWQRRPLAAFALIALLPVAGAMRLLLTTGEPRAAGLFILIWAPIVVAVFLLFLKRGFRGHLEGDGKTPRVKGIAKFGVLASGPFALVNLFRLEEHSLGPVIGALLIPAITLTVSVIMLRQEARRQPRP